MSHPSVTVELLYDAKAKIGEGPFYDHERNQLLWVDIQGHTINFLDLGSRVNRCLQMADTVGAVIPLESSEKVVAVLGRKICLVDRETGAFEELAVVDRDKPNNRINDSKCDCAGRLWCGTMAEETKPAITEPNMGSLYSFTGGHPTKHVSDITIANGMDWSANNTVMYHIDSIAKTVSAFDYSVTDGTLKNHKVLIDYAQDSTLGYPDGMCTDSQGRLWVAGFLGKSVVCWDPITGHKLDQVEIPAMRVTSCCFGGPNFDWLFVTSARHLANDEELAALPHSGGIFVIKGLGIKGCPAHRFKYTLPAQV